MKGITNTQRYSALGELDKIVDNLFLVWEMNMKENIIEF